METAESPHTHTETQIAGHLASPEPGGAVATRAVPVPCPRAEGSSSESDPP